MVFKVVYKVAGGHTHMRVWAGSRAGSLGLAGELVMLNEEFYNFRKIMEAAHALLDTVIFEEQQVTSAPATRENNGFRPA